MKKIILSLVLLLAVAGCSRNDGEAIEEKVLLSMFTGYVTGIAYDEFCNGVPPESRYDTEQKKNVLLLGNEQMLAARLGGIWHVRNPGKSVDEGVEYMIRKRNQISDKAKEVFKEQGCQSEMAQGAKQAYELFSQVHPAVIMGMADKKIKEAGGTVTPFDEIEAAGKTK